MVPTQEASYATFYFQYVVRPPSSMAYPRRIPTAAVCGMHRAPGEMLL